MVQMTTVATTKTMTTTMTTTTMTMTMVYLLLLFISAHNCVQETHCKVSRCPFPKQT